MARPKLPPGSTRLPLSCRVAPATLATIDALARAADVQGQGQALDALAAEARRAPILRSIILALTARLSTDAITQWAPADCLRAQGISLTPAEIDALEWRDIPGIT